MGRKISAGFLGVIIGLLGLIVVRYLGHLVVPGEETVPVDGLGATSFGYQLIEVLAWFIGTQAGVWAALLFSGGSRRATVITAGAMLAIIVLILFSVTHPAWMVATGLLLPVLSVFAATRFVPFDSA